MSVIQKSKIKKTKPIRPSKKPRYKQMFRSDDFLRKVAELTQGQKDLRDTAVIGGMGMGLGTAAGHAAEKFLPRIAKSPKKLGALTGAAGIVADYAGVRINRAMEKEAQMTNKYLEKIAETYSVRHTQKMEDAGLEKDIQLNRKEHDAYLKGMGDAMQGKRIATHLGGGAAIGAATGVGLTHAVGIRGVGPKALAGYVGALGGAAMGATHLRRKAHNESLENVIGDPAKKLSDRKIQWK